MLAELREALENNGFTAAEAERIIIPIPQGILPLGIQPKTVQVAPEEIDVTVALVQVAALGGKARIDTAKGEITVLVPLDDDETEMLTSCVKTPESKSKIVEAVTLVREAEKAFGGTGKTRVPSPYEQRIDFAVPILCIRENGQLFEFESTFLLEHPWKLSLKDASLADEYNPLKRPAGQAGLVDIARTGQVETSIVSDSPTNDFVATLHQHVLALGDRGDWTVEKLVAWLDSKIDHQDIPVGESAEFLRKVIRGLMAKYGIDDVTLLALDCFRLRDEITKRINQHRDSERKAAFQTFLFPDSAVVVSDERAINFKNIVYEPSQLYEGSFLFKKHYFGAKPGELSEKRSDGKLMEEFKCAQFIDGMPEVRFWARNLPKRKTSFRLQTSKDWFYPDFICQLTDGRTIAIEYKGEHLYGDAEEKRAVGQVWASRSGGRCLFVMPTEGDFSTISRVVKL